MSLTVTVQGLMGEKTVKIVSCVQREVFNVLWEDRAKHKIKKLKFSLPKNKPKPQNTKVYSIEKLPPEITWKMIHHWYF